MTPASVARKPTASHNASVAQSLQDVLADTYGLYIVTQNYHWNVEGPHFLTLHQLFEAQYTELTQAIDVIAEHIRALGHYALPFEGDNILQATKMISNPLNKEKLAADRANRMIANLVTMTDLLIKRCQAAKAVAQDADDNETEDLMVGRIKAHQKSMWFLNSLIK